jgi:hypothetical protein
MFELKNGVHLSPLVEVKAFRFCNFFRERWPKDNGRNTAVCATPPWNKRAVGLVVQMISFVGVAFLFAYANFQPISLDFWSQQWMESNSVHSYCGLLDYDIVQSGRRISTNIPQDLTDSIFRIEVILIFVTCYKVDQINEDEMDRACCTHGGDEKCTHNFRRKSSGELAICQLASHSAGGRIILKRCV